MNEWPKDTKVKHIFIPGIFKVDGPVQKNEIGYLLMPVRDHANKRHWFKKKNLIKHMGGVQRDTGNADRNTPGDLPGLFSKLL